MSYQRQEFEDPKIILSASLLRQKDAIAGQINAGNHAEALKALATLITQCIIEPNEKEVIQAEEELVENTKVSKIPSAMVMHYWQVINDYLNKTYFADYHKARPKFQHEGHI